MNTLTETKVRLFASAKSWIEGEAVRQLYATAKLEGMRLAVGFPDLHPGKGTPVGAAFVTEGRRSIRTSSVATSAAAWRCSRRTWSAATSSSTAGRDAVRPRTPWTDEISEFLAEEELESTEFDEALGTIGGGNHFAELQAVEEVLDAREFKKLGLGKQQLVVLVHSGSRGLGESILRGLCGRASGKWLGRGVLCRRRIPARSRPGSALGQGESRAHRAALRATARCRS